VIIKAIIIIRERHEFDPKIVFGIGGWMAE